MKKDQGTPEEPMMRGRMPAWLNPSSVAIRPHGLATVGSSPIKSCAQRGRRAAGLQNPSFRRLTCFSLITR